MNPTTSAAYSSILNAFVFEPFTRGAARRAGLEEALRICELAGLVKFVRCIGAAPDGAGYNSDNELFRVVFA